MASNTWFSLMSAKVSRRRTQEESHKSPGVLVHGIRQRYQNCPFLILASIETWTLSARRQLTWHPPSSWKENRSMKFCGLFSNQRVDSIGCHTP